jgi:hypothetical protein
VVTFSCFCWQIPEALKFSIWVSDEYGPYIHHFTKDGHLIQTIQPPPALLPRTATGVLNFTASTDPATGRIGNQGKYLNDSIVHHGPKLLCTVQV